MSHTKDKDGGRSSRIQARDDNWAKFEEYARQRESVGEGNFPLGARNPLSPTSGRLHKEDMAIYGREPATDNMVLVVCDICNRTVKSQAFMKHKEYCHPESIKGPSLHRVPLHTTGQSSSVFGTVPNGNTLEGRKKAIDLDRHCGVWMENDKKHCKKSISCKIHSLEQRRKVGRSRPLSELISEYKRNKKIRKMERLKTGQTNNPSLISPAHHHPPSNHPLSPISPFTPQSPKPPPERFIRRGSPPHPSINYYFDEVEVEGLEQDGGIDEVAGKVSPELTVSEAHLYPKPAAVCSFGRRVTCGRGSSSLFSHRLDSLRSSLVFLAGREKDFNDVTIPDSSIRRKYSSNLNHRTQQKRKYAHLGRDQNHILLAEHKLTTPSLSSPSLPSTSNIKPSSFYSNSSHAHPLTTPTPSTEQAFVTKNQHVLSNSQSNNEIGGRKHKRSFRNDDMSFNDSSHDGLGQLPLTNRRLSNHIQEGRPPQIEFEQRLIKRQHQEQFSNHVDHHWAESEGMSTDAPPDFQPIKIAPPTINGVINSPGSLSGMVQPFSFNSQQTYLLNPSQQQSSPFPRGIVPIGLGVPHTPPSTSFQPPQPMPVPLLYPGDKPDPSLIQLMTQSRVALPPSSAGVHDGMGGAVGMDINQFVRVSGVPVSENNHINNYHQPGQYGIQPKQFDGAVPHQFNDNNYFGEFGINLTNMNPLGGQFPANVLSPYTGTAQSSPDNLPRHASSPSVHQMMAGGLVQSSNELITNSPLPPYPPLSSQSPIGNPPIHRPSPNSKPGNTYLHPSQTGMVGPQTAAQRTQRVT